MSDLFGTEALVRAVAMVLTTLGEKSVTFTAADFARMDRLYDIRRFVNADQTSVTIYLTERAADQKELPMAGVEAAGEGINSGTPASEF